MNTLTSIITATVIAASISYFGNTFITGSKFDGASATSDHGNQANPAFAEVSVDTTPVPTQPLLDNLKDLLPLADEPTSEVKPLIQVVSEPVLSDVLKTKSLIKEGAVLSSKEFTDVSGEVIIAAGYLAHEELMALKDLLD